MKRSLAFAMAALLMLSFAGCSLLEKPGEFDYIVRLLEDGDYDEAIEEINELKEDEERDRDRKDKKDKPSDEEAVVEAPAAAAPTAPVEQPATEPPMPEESTPAAEEEPAVPEETTAPRVRVKLLTNITITRVDNLGNESSDTYYFYNRDSEGRIVKIGGHDMAMEYGFYLHTFADYLRLTYTADGLIENAKVVDSWDNVSALGTPTYDENGNMISMHIVTNTEEFTLNFAYDANGNRIRADIFDTFWQEISFANTYTYDGEGRLLKEYWDMVGFGNTGRTIEYTYDENGLLAQSYTTWHTNKPWHETTVYTLNENGDPILAVTTSDTIESGYKTKTTEYTYSTFAVAP